MAIVGNRADAGSIYLEDVCYSYESGVVALQNLNVEIPLGSRLAIVGPSGCGKTTLLHLLAGILSPDRGQIAWPRIASASHVRSMVFQTDTLLPWLNVLDNVGLAFRLRGKGRKAYSGRAHELLTLVGLERFAHAYPYELSGGMRRRVAFLSALAPNPAVLLLDEPFAALDEPTRLAIHQDVLKILAETQMTLVVITHDIAEAITLCDTVSIMSNRPGRVVSTHSVPFGHDRDPYDLRKTDSFLNLYRSLWQTLSEQLTRRAGDDGSQDHGNG